MHFIMKGIGQGRAGFTMLVLAAGLVGCGRKDAADDLKIAATPAAAAAQVEQVFQSAEPAVKEVAGAASEAVRSGDFEKAVVALRSLSDRPPAAVTIEQGLAVHGYTVNLEASLINAAAAGDEKAKRAYELLKQMKRK